MTNRGASLGTGERLHGEVRADRPLLVVALEIEARNLHVHQLPILVTGVGKVNAATALSLLLAAGRPSLVINLGTAGALRPGLEGPQEITRVHQHDLNSRAISLLCNTWPGPEVVTDTKNGTPEVILTTGDRFISSAEDAASLAPSAHLVDMEGYGVARVATAFGVPVRIVKTVSDNADDHAARDWVDQMEHCARNLGDWVHQHLYDDRMRTHPPGAAAS